MVPLAALPLAALLLLGLGSTTVAQLTDLQPGRNFPVADMAFGTGRSENIDAGDVDRDGDLDVLVANGGDGAAQANALFINAGGLQPGSPGSFTDESATRLAGVTIDTSRDCELVDMDADGDLDVFISNRGNTANGGEVSRAYTNLGGLQFGTVGFFSESTDDFWGDLVSIPGGDEVGVVDGQGPFRGYSCDCDFGDLNDDGMLDAFWSSYGPNINGTRDSLIFLNDGNGRFDELWPWVDAGADIRMHTLDVDLVDLDGDWDLDLFASSRDSQARVFRSNLNGGTGAGQLYTDMTQTALIDTGAGATSNFLHYESEYADVDGDDDFDLWAVSYNGFKDVVLINHGDFTFTKHQGLIAGDPSLDENEADFVDFDGDGDLDVFSANFSGTNLLYQSGLAQGGGAHGTALFHRTGSSAGGSQAPWPEVPASGNGGITLDGQAADLDNDGDPDLLLANDANQNNRLWFNVLGVPDAHAPEFMALTEQADKTDDTDTVIRARLRDNAPYYAVAASEVDLLYSVDGGPPTRVQMASQGGQQFRGVIPAAVSGEVSYHVEASDRAGNTGVSQTVTYTQTSGVSSLWQTVGGGTSGVVGDPHLVGRGQLTAGSTTRLGLIDTASGTLDALFLSAASTPVPFKGGTLHTFPVGVTFNLLTGSGGLTWIEFPFPAGVPGGLQLWWQHALADGTQASGVALSNAVLGTSP